MEATLPEVLALLVLGHVLGAHALPTHWSLPQRASVLGVIHLVCLTPVFAGQVLLWAVALAVAYAVIETVVSPLEPRSGAGPIGLIVRHAANAAVLIAFSRPLEWHLPQEHRAAVFQIAVLVSALVFVTVAGSDFVRRTLGDQLPRAGTEESRDPSELPTPGMGQRIGVLERCLTLLLGVIEAWAGLGLIIAAKSIARFKDLEDRRFAEYYLVGTLCSVLVAVVVAMLTRIALGYTPVVLVVE